jgi:hypothetical protein
MPKSGCQSRAPRMSPLPLSSDRLPYSDTQRPGTDRSHSRGWVRVQRKAEMPDLRPRLHTECHDGELRMLLGGGENARLGRRLRCDRVCLGRPESVQSDWENLSRVDQRPGGDCQRTRVRGSLT